MFASSPIASRICVIFTCSGSTARNRAVANRANSNEQSTRTAPSHAPMICTHAPIPPGLLPLLTFGPSSICNIPPQISSVNCRTSFSCICMFLSLTPGPVIGRGFVLHAFKIVVEIQGGLGTAHQKKSIGPQLSACLSENAFLHLHIEVDQY